MQESDLIFDWNTVDYEFKRNPLIIRMKSGLMMKLYAMVCKALALEIRPLKRKLSC